MIQAAVRHSHPARPCVHRQQDQKDSNDSPNAQESTSAFTSSA
jgi:hypothetical protein